MFDISLYTAVSAKARALYGKQLSSSEFAHISNMTSVTQIAAFLKQHRSFHEVLSGINETNIRRSYLESLLKLAYFNDYEKLRHFLSKEDLIFFKYYIMSLEMEYVLAFVRHLNAGDPSAYRQYFTRKIDTRLPLDIEALTHASTYRQMLSASRESDFYPVLQRFEPTDGAPVNYTALECALEGWRFNRMMKNAEKIYGGDIQLQIKNSLGTQIDIINISRVLRLRSFFPDSPEAVFQYLIPVYRRLDTDFFRSLFLQPSDEAALLFIRKSPLGSYFMGKSLYIEMYYERYLYSHYNKMIHAANSSILVPIAYLALRQIEIRNLTHIIESVRYGVPPSGMTEYLTVPHRVSDSEN